jgi:hypothetical protein
MAVTTPDTSPAFQALNIGVNPESDEERKRRLQAISQSQQRLGAAAGIMSPAGSSLGLGGGNGVSGI